MREGEARWVWVRRAVGCGLVIALALATISRTGVKQSSKSSTLKESHAATETKKPLPNIVFILLDDVGFNDLGAHSTDLSAATPFMNELATTGVRLTHYYSQQVCTPARAALLTGLYPIHNGMAHGVISGPMPWGLPLEYPTLPLRLKSVGPYATFAVGKWHLGHFNKDYLPIRRGFDKFYGFYTGYQDYFDYYSEPMEYKNLYFQDLHDGEDRVDASDKQFNVFEYTEKAEEFILNHTSTSKDPFFLYMAHPAAHKPIESPLLEGNDDTYSSILDQISYPRKEVAAVQITADLSVQHLVELLDKLSLRDNTLVIVASDNGGDPSSNSWGNNWPLRGTKSTLYEGGTRVTAFVNSPLLPAAANGAVRHGLFHVTDWVPTIIEGLLGSHGACSLLDGINQWGYITRGGEPPRSSIVYNIDADSDYQGAIRKDEWKLYYKAPIEVGWYLPGSEYSNADINWADTDNLLFNLATDPFEKIDLKDDYPDVYQSMLKEYWSIASGIVPSAYCDLYDYHALNWWVSINSVEPWIHNLREFTC